jgi:hypothetical protein
MNTQRIPLRASLLAVVGVLWFVSAASAQWVTQTVQLSNGWNAVYLRVQPFPAACDEVFANLPVTNVCRYNARVLTTQFDTDPTQPFQRPDEWLTWAPKDGVSEYTRTLENLLGGTAYLVAATNNCVLTLRGQPVIPRFQWVPGQPNLVGFPISLSPDQQPYFATFFRYEPAIDAEEYVDRTNIAMIGPDLQPVNITRFTARSKMEPGRAYWIRAQSASDYVGPMRVSTSDPNGLLFGQQLNELFLQVRNACNSNPAPLTVTLRHVSSETPPTNAPPMAGAVPLLYADRTATNWVWRAWPTEQSQNWTLTNGQVLTLQLSVNRGAMAPPANPNALWQSLLQVTCDQGTFIQVPLSAAYDSGDGQLAAFPYGLWVGEARISEVSSARFDTNAQAEASTPPLPAGGSFPLRLILHAGSDGDYRLLSSAVIAALQDASSNTVNRIYTDGSHVPAGATIVTRVSSAAFGRIAPVGLVGPGFLSALSGSYVIDYDDPLNPFKHIYHPDHDNLDANRQKLPEGLESFTISNRVQFTWNTVPDPVLGGTLWRPDESVTGTYEHTISNLRHTPITLRGAFTLRRVSRVGVAE